MFDFDQLQFTHCAGLNRYKPDQAVQAYKNILLPISDCYMGLWQPL